MYVLFQTEKLTGTYWCMREIDDDGKCMGEFVFPQGTVFDPEELQEFCYVQQEPFVSTDELFPAIYYCWPKGAG